MESNSAAVEDNEGKPLCKSVDVDPKRSQEPLSSTSTATPKASHEKPSSSGGRTNISGNGIGETDLKEAGIPRSKAAMHPSKIYEDSEYSIRKDEQPEMITTRSDDRADVTGDTSVKRAERSDNDSTGDTRSSPASLFPVIPKKKRRRLEKESRIDEQDDKFVNATEDEDEDEDMNIDVSLNQLKRQVLGRDLKVDDEENRWEDENDAEIRQIRALMNASNDDDDDDDDDYGNHQSKETADKKYTENGSTERKLVAASTETTPSKLSSLPEKLRKDLMCAICHEVVYPPVALQCGHTFCRPCIEWWFDHDEAGRCPTCRSRSFPGSGQHSKESAMLTSPNLALRACVMAMFGPEIVVRLQNLKKVRPKGEAGGAHDAGYQVLSELGDETWHYVPVRTDTGNPPNPSNTATTVQVRRSIVLDAEDQRMQLALAIYHKPTKEVSSGGNNSRGHDERFRVELCLLTMEEDEAVDTGFPALIISPDDEFFVCGRSRFLYSHVEVQMKDENGRLSPLARVSANPSNGRFQYVLDPSDSAGNASTKSIRALLFQHSETNSQLEIDLAQLQDRAGGSSLLPPTRNLSQNNRRHRNYYDSDEEYGDDRNLVVGQHDDTEEAEEEDDDKDLDEFEDDGFLVGDDDESSQEDEDDRCVVCKDGGELMICDGGDTNPGCGKSFHAACVNRSVIPNGDWICQACARTGGLETGIEGHEFLQPGETSDPVRDQDGAGDASGDLRDHKKGESSDVEGTFSDASGDLAGDDGDGDNCSVVNGTFSDQDLYDGGDQETTSLDAENDSVSQEQPDTPALKLSSKNEKKDTKRRFVLEDSDSD